jgi:hypothetical protein
VILSSFEVEHYGTSWGKLQYPYWAVELLWPKPISEISMISFQSDSSLIRASPVPSMVWIQELWSGSNCRAIVGLPCTEDGSSEQLTADPPKDSQKRVKHVVPRFCDAEQMRLAKATIGTSSLTVSGATSRLSILAGKLPAPVGPLTTQMN